LLKSEEVVSGAAEMTVHWSCWFCEFGLGFVGGDVGDVWLGLREIDDWLGGRVVAPGAYGIQIGDELGGEMRGEGFAAELYREGVGEVLEHSEADKDGVARDPGLGFVAEEAELKREMRALEIDGGVDAAGVDLKVVKFARSESGDGAIGGGANLKNALGAVVGQERSAQDLGELAGGVAAENVHLEEAVAGGDEALGEDEIVERVGVDVRHTVRVALDGDRRSEAVDVE
jgi:hypothetical protein